MDLPSLSPNDNLQIPVAIYVTEDPIKTKSKARKSSKRNRKARTLGDITSSETQKYPESVRTSLSLGDSPLSISLENNELSSFKIPNRKSPRKHTPKNIQKKTPRINSEEELKDNLEVKIPFKYLIPQYIPDPDNLNMKPIFGKKITIYPSYKYNAYHTVFRINIKRNHFQPAVDHHIGEYICEGYDHNLFTYTYGLMTQKYEGKKLLIDKHLRFGSSKRSISKYMYRYGVYSRGWASNDKEIKFPLYITCSTEPHNMTTFINMCPMIFGFFFHKSGDSE